MIATSIIAKPKAAASASASSCIISVSSISISRISIIIIISCNGIISINIIITAIAQGSSKTAHDG